MSPTDSWCHRESSANQWVANPVTHFPMPVTISLASDYSLMSPANSWVTLMTRDSDPGDTNDLQRPSLIRRAQLSQCRLRSPWASLVSSRRFRSATTSASLLSLLARSARAPAALA